MPDPSTQADPTADDATALRACSASLEIIKAGGRGWPMPLPHPPEYRPAATDLTGWRIAARSILPKVGTVFVAVSPDSKLTALCRVYTPGTRGEKGFRSEVLPFLQPPRTLTPYVIGGDGAYGPCDACRGWLTEAVGRIPPKVVRFRVEGKNQAIDIPVRNGWYALIWDGPKEFGLKATAYDAAGRVVRPSS